MNIIFQIDGGIGKSIAATAVCKAIKRQYPNDRLIVITGYPDVFLCNPHVYKVFSHNDMRYFYKDYIEGQEVKMMLHNPYLETDFINQQGPLNKIWCEMFGITYNNEQPELYLNDRERNFFGNTFQSNRPIMLIQTNGGAANQPNKYSWARDLPMGTAQKVVDTFASEYEILHVRRKDQLPLRNTKPVHADFRAIATLISLSSKRLFIDSFCQHTAAALNMPSVVCWISNIPQQFGYDLHTNIVANPPTIEPELRYSVYSKYNISGQPVEFCYNNESEIFDAERIIAGLRGQNGIIQAQVAQNVNSGVDLNKDEMRVVTNAVPA